MPAFVTCNALNGDVVYVNLDNVLKLKERQNGGGTMITFVNGTSLTVTTSPQSVVGVG
jgi:uncharacterized protein YlzI (FlbEa/FlbD family)